MANRDIVVIGASAGGIAAVKLLLSQLPRDLEAAIFVVIHIGANSSSELAQILSQAGPLKAQWAADNQPFEKGRVYVARADMHLLLRDERTFLVRGPRENLARPAIDPMFRSAAAAYDGRVIGVILSGMLSDGTAGLMSVKRAGGIAMVQEPADAEHPDMPESALAWVTPDVVAPVRKLAEQLVRYVRDESVTAHIVPEDLRQESEIAFGAKQGMNEPKKLGERSVYSCPECNGALWEIKEGDLSRYRCHVGHAFSSDSMLDANGEMLERALWSAMRVLEERIRMMDDMARRAGAAKRSSSAERFRERTQEYEAQRDVLRALLVGTPPAPAKRGAQSS